MHWDCPSTLVAAVGPSTDGHGTRGYPYSVEKHFHLLEDYQWLKITEETDEMNKHGVYTQELGNNKTLPMHFTRFSRSVSHEVKIKLCNGGIIHMYDVNVTVFSFLLYIDFRTMNYIFEYTKQDVKDRTYSKIC